MDYSCIPERFISKSFDDYQPVNASAAKALKSVRRYAENAASDNHGGQSIMLCGKVGAGKTHLSCATLKYVIEQTAMPCRYMTFSEIVRLVKETFQRDSKKTEKEVYEKLGSLRLLVIDEVGMQNATEFERTVAYEAINARYLNMLPTMIISNLNPKGIEECLGDRVVDRLRENNGVYVMFDWDSYRKQS